MYNRTLLLIDAMNVAYRSFYAIPELSTSDGRPTNAVLGFIKATQQLLATWRPTHWAVVFDGGLPEERMELLETYKAQRDPMPDPLEAQLEAIDEYLERAEISSLWMDGQEADDLMATAAARACSDGAQVFLATSDKDMFQLVSHDIVVVPPSKAGVRMGPEEVEEKTGVMPHRIVEWLALIGDSVDNIPGVPGVGPKTATKLLTQFSSLDELWANLGDVSSDKLRSKLEAHKEVVTRNLSLVRLRKDLACDWAWDDLAVREPDPEKMLPFYEDLELGSLARASRKALAERS